MIKQWRELAGEWGQSALEFIVVLPIILVIIMAGAEVSWYSLDRIGLELCVRGLAENVRGPDTRVIGWENRRGVWKVGSGGRKPDWLTMDQRTDWSFDDYDGWLGFGEFSGTNSPGSLYYRYSEDKERDFKERAAKEKRRLIDSNKLTYKIKGGWYVKTLGFGIPSVKDPEWHGVLSEGRMQQYYVDVVVEGVYLHKPLSLVGKILLGADASGYCQLKAHRRFTSPVKEVWLQ